MKIKIGRFSNENISDLKLLFELDQFIKEDCEYVKLNQDDTKKYTLFPMTKEYVNKHRNEEEDPDLYAYRRGFEYIYRIKERINEYVSEEVFDFYHKLTNTQKEN